MTQTKLFSIFIVVFSWCTHGAQNLAAVQQEWEQAKADWKSEIEANSLPTQLAGQTLLLGAVLNDDTQFAQLLVALGYTFLQKYYHLSGYEPLLFAAKSPAMVQCLLDNKADVNARSDNGMSILEAYASRDHHPYVMRNYIDQGLSDISENDQSLFLLLHKQFTLSSTVIQKLVALINAGVSLDTRQVIARTARHLIFRNTIVQDLKIRLRKTRKEETRAYQDLESILGTLEQRAKDRKHDIKGQCMDVIKIPALANIILDFYEKENFDQTEEEIDFLIALENL